MSEIRIGAHVEQDDPLAEAAARQAPLVQFFLGDPQGYKGPEVRYPGGAEKLRADAEAAGVDLYVHASSHPILEHCTALRSPAEVVAHR